MRTIQQAASNLQASVSLIPARYRQGVEGADWATSAGSESAEQLYATKVQEAIAQKRRQRGVQRVGNEAWRAAALNNGAPIIGSRITASIGKYQTNFGPVLDAMTRAASSLKPKTGDLATDIANRVTPVAQAARNASPKRAGSVR